MSGIYKTQFEAVIMDRVFNYIKEDRGVHCTTRTIGKWIEDLETDLRKGGLGFPRIRISNIGRGAIREYAMSQIYIR